MGTMKLDWVGWSSIARPAFALGAASGDASYPTQSRLPPASPRCYLGGVNLDRELRLTTAKERWVTARAGREVRVSRGSGDRFLERWVVVFVEDGKAVARARGATLPDALESVLSALGKLNLVTGG